MKKYILLFIGMFLLGAVIANTPGGAGLNEPIQGGGGVIQEVEINVGNETEPITFSKMNAKCITGCVNDILNRTFIILDDGTVSGEAYTIIEMLKAMNYGLGEELDVCQAKLDKANINKYIMIFSVIIALILIIWKTSEVINARNKKEKR